MFGRIFACALRDRLVADARALDPAAIELLLQEVPRELSTSTRKAARDRELRKLWNWLKATHPEAKSRPLAEMLEAAGRRLEGQRKTLSGADFPTLTGAELSEFQQQTRSLRL